MKNSYSNWVEIDLSAIKHNVAYVHQLTGVNVMAVVKANGYGHGDLPVAKAALNGGANWLGVARVDEALKLRQDGLDCPILLLGHTPTGRLTETINNQISLTVWENAQVKQASKIGIRLGKSARLHLKVDTGMGRLGTTPEGAIRLAKFINQQQGVILEGIFTHFARADEIDTNTSTKQETKFRHTLNELNSINITPRVIHAANSAASLTRPSACFDMIRLGIAMYGLNPSNEVRIPSSMTPALSWKSVLSQVKELPAKFGLSYGHEYQTKGKELIGTIPVGYADGYRRTKNNIVLVNGHRAPVVGRVCMDQILVKLDKKVEAQSGQEVVLLGVQGNERISAEEIAKSWNTINYEVVCGISSRVPRFYS